jgi:NAD(P)H-hydrate repair Nnr-like enzyme with NAD(P)H-hydrate dehydratase domain
LAGAKGEIFVNPSGNPHLAQGGSGDVLAGFIAGLLAQPALQADAGENDPLRRLAARLRGGQIAGNARKLGRGRFGGRTRQRAVLFFIDPDGFLGVCL